MIYNAFDLKNSGFNKLFESLDKFDDDGYFDFDKEYCDDEECIEECNSLKESVSANFKRMEVAILDELERHGFDSNSDDVQNYASAAVDLIVNDPEFTDRPNFTKLAKEWYKDTKFNFPEELDELTKLEECINECSDISSIEKPLKKDRKLEEASDKVTLQITYEPYERYTSSGVKTVNVSGKDELSALKRAIDRMCLYISREQIEEENMSVDDVIEELESSNGDGCDYIVEIKNLNTGNILLSSDWEEESWDNEISMDDVLEFVDGNQEAAEIIYNWLDAEDALYDDPDEVLSYDNLADLVDAATDEDERRIVAAAIGMELEDEDIDESLTEAAPRRGMTKVIIKRNASDLTEASNKDLSNDEWISRYRSKRSVKNKVGLKESCNKRKFIKRK